MRRIFHLTDSALTTFLVEGRTLVAAVRYENDAKGIARFRRDLERAPDLVSRLVLDITGEEFHDELVPHVFSRDQHKILQRKIQQRYGRLRWVWHQHQGREKRGRRDDRYLVGAVTRPEVVEAWLVPIEAVGVPLEAITSVPLLTPRLARLLQVRGRQQLFVSLDDRDGIRQTFISNGRLRASRLAPMRRGDDEQIADQVLEEVARMKRFLHSTHLLPWNEELQVILLAGTRLIALMGRVRSKTEEVHYHHYDLHALAARFRFKGFEDTDHAGPFFALLAAGRRRPQSYATSSERHCYFHHQARAALQRLALVVTLGGVVGVAWQMAGVVEEHRRIADLENQILDFQGRRARLVARDPEAARHDGFAMAEAVRFEHQLRPWLGSPFEVLEPLGRSLLGHPDIRLKNLEVIQNPPPAAGDEMAPPQPGPPRIQVLASGVMEKNGRAYRVLYKEFRELLQRLVKTERFEMPVVERWPLEVRPDRSLVLVDQQTRQEDEIPFRIRLTAREAP